MIARSKESNTAGSPYGRTLWVLFLGTAVLLLWVATQRWLVPGLIRSAYDQESIPFFNAFIDGQARHSVDLYLDTWRRLAGLATVALGVLVVLAAASIPFHTRIYRATVRAHGFLLRGNPGVGLRRALALGGIAGCLGGAMEAVAWLADTRGEPSGPALEVLWMAPLAAAVVAALLAALTWALAGGRQVSLRTLLVVLLTFAVYTAVAQAGFGIHAAALTLLALGLAVEASRHLVRRRLDDLAPRIVAALLGALLLGAGSMKGVESWAERRGLSALSAGAGSGGAADRPNILLLILDTVRAQNLSLYGYARSTSPRLVELARESVVFDRALATSSWTLPSHATLLTGLEAAEHSADWYRPMRADQLSIAEALADVGYATGAFIANQAFGRRRSGMDQGFIAYRDNPADLDEVVEYHWAAKALGHYVYQALGRVRGDARKTADEVNDELLDWLDGLEGAPFFAMVNYYDAHDPYESPAPFNTLFRPRPPRALLSNWGDEAEYVEAEMQEMVDAYDSSIAYLDDRVGHLLDGLREAGILDETIVVVTSDHGEHFGERGIVLHGNSLYLPSLHVPLLVRLPDRAVAGVRVGRTVSIRDVPATLLDLARIEREYPGTSLARLWQRERPADGSAERPGAPTDGSTPALASLSSNEFVLPTDPVARGAMRSVTTDRFHYILNGDGVEELFDLTGAGEEMDLAARPALADDLRRLRAALGSVVGSATPEVSSEGADQTGERRTNTRVNGQGRVTASSERD